MGDDRIGPREGLKCLVRPYRKAATELPSSRTPEGRTVPR
jgi:hypothetical protein